MPSLPVAALLMCCALRLAAQDHPQVNAGAATLADFDKRVADYVKLRQKIEGKLPPLEPTSSPAAILHHEHELAEHIRKARADAKPGDIFTPEIGQEFRRIMGYALEGKNSAHVEKSLKNAEPVRLKLHANERYPHAIPLQSTPPTILMNLPKLPQELEYRVNGHDLILLDTKANLIVDILWNAVP
jgi:hypothetical protein